MSIAMKLIQEINFIVFSIAFLLSTLICSAKVNSKSEKGKEVKQDEKEKEVKKEEPPKNR